MAFFRLHLKDKRGALRPLLGVSVSIALCLVLSGCGTAFTNGGIPPGRSTIIGQVVQAGQPQTPVGNANVSIVTSSPNYNPKTYVVTTKSDGTFSLLNIPTDNISSNVTITTDPNDASLQQQKVSFHLTNKHAFQLLLTLPPQSINLSTVTNVDLKQVSAPNVSPVVFKPEVRDSQNNLINLFPSMIFDGSIGVLQTNADVTKDTVQVFAPSGLPPGSPPITTEITATFDTGKLTQPTSVATATVEPDLNHLGDGANHTTGVVGIAGFSRH